MTITKIVQERESVESVHYTQWFADPNTQEVLYKVSVNADGSHFCWGNPDAKIYETDEFTIGQSQERNLNDLKKKAAEGTLVDKGIHGQNFSFQVPKIGLCECGTEVELTGFTCTCPGCGRDYNSSGNELASRAQWGEETGETAADILMI